MRRIDGRIGILGVAAPAWLTASWICLIAVLSVANGQSPVALSFAPSKNAIGVSVSASVSVSFNVAMDVSTISSSTFRVITELGGVCAGSVTYNPLTKSATFLPSTSFEYGTTVWVTLTTAIKSQAGIPLIRPYSWSFTTFTEGGDGSFMRDSIYSIGVSPFAICSIDLDDDGDADLATANPASNSVSTLFNIGNAEFVYGSSYPAFTSPHGIISADFDSDGHSDVAVANGFSSDISIFFNSGSGSLAAGSKFPVGDFPVSLCRSDLDGDGDIDIASANTYSNNVSVLINDGSGVFTDRMDYPVGAEPYCVTAADIDNDADFDLVTCNDVSGTISVLLNGGDGTFAAHVDYSTCFGPIFVCGSDFDGDGDIDLVTTNDGADSVSVLMNLGAGVFGPYNTYPVGEKPVCVAASDLDSDGDMDLVSSGYFEDGVSTLLGSGSGTFVPSQGCTTGDGAQGIVLADLDGDGDVDAAVCDVLSQNVAVLLNAVVCADSDTDGFGDPLHPENECPEDNCPYAYNPDQTDSDGDSAGDSCDICPSHTLDDCCNPRGINSPPTFTSPAIDTAIPGELFVYVASATDPDCDGSELEIDFVQIPSWCERIGDTIRGMPECSSSDTVLRLTAQDGSAFDLLVVTLIVDRSNVGPVIEGTSAYRAFAAGQSFLYYPDIHDPDDSLLEISYPGIPDWCHVLADTVSGISPARFSAQTLMAVAADYCHADTLEFTVYSYICGDANSSGYVDIDDIVYLIEYIFGGGERPVPIESADCDCQSGVDIDDLVHLICHVFQGGPAPCIECP
jgi:hypothetical protein